MPENERLIVNTSMWREDGQYLLLRDVLATIQLFPSLHTAVYDLYRNVEAIIREPSLVEEFRTDAFRLKTVEHFVRSEPGSFHVNMSHCRGKVCVYGAIFVPSEQDGYSILSDRLDFAYSRSLIWIQRCPRDHGTPEIV